MSSSNKDSWSLPPSGPGVAPSPHGTDQQGQAPQARPLGGFGSNSNLQQGSSGPGGPVLPPPPSAPFYSPAQSGSHNLPTLGELTQSTQPQQHPPAPTAPQQQPPTSSPAQQLGQTQSANYSLPSLGQSIQQQTSQVPSSLDRERELRERDREARDRRQHEDAAQRERELRERELRERQQREHQQSTQPHQNHAGSIPIHQPVASKVTTAIHGPGGLLSNIGSAAGTSAPPGPLGVPNGPGNMFGGPLPLGQLAVQGLAGAPIPQQHQVMTFGGAPAPDAHRIPGGVTGLPQGQQPILNDALSYLDQVKVQFVDQPDVYNLFLEIMKDFKSQAIDTPGVIDRVSNLFAGHPNLIQGFNTFLPPGYRIECGTGDDPNAIRVTTPMGTTVQSMSSGIRPPSNPPGGAPTGNGVGPAARQGSYYDQISRNSNGNWQQQSQHGASDGLFSPRGPAVTPQIFGHQPAQGQILDGQTQREQQSVAANAAAVAQHQHQQEQRGVSQLQNAVSVAANGPQVVRQVMMQSTPPVGQSSAINQQSAAVNSVVSGPGPQQAVQGGMEKRGPVEFNHAISYVNKIKNRFAAQPEIYKQFLEILQTYQRESKPIQDVYAQVTQLFNSAPDLLEDFKQFLPESAAQAKAQAAAKQAAEDAAILSNVRGDAGYLAGAQPSHAIQQSQGGAGIPPRLPPVGNFAPPPSVGKESKKRVRGAAAQTATASSAQSMTPTADMGGSQAGGSRVVSNQGSNVTKRPKLHHNKPPQPDVSAVSPTLTPALPEPLPPTSNGNPPVEEIAFFDRVKKFIGNKQTMNEFLKLCNLFSQDLIDKNILVNKASSFIGGNPDLFSWFKRWVGYDGRDEIIENKPKASNGKVILSNCRGLGPSYRLLPKRERLKQCSGRDEMCYKVLNDEWASHPTWASEDSGFVAHRKNVYEEALHKIEEERHDYDHNIEANLRTIQLLEPIAQKIAGMSPEERSTFTLPPGLHGQSQAIYQRVIKKIYDRERGQRVIDDLHARPCAVVPQLLMRLKQKNEEWRAAQREWEKLWREQTHKAFWKSLDHMGINAKTADKRNFQLKTFTTEIQTKHQEYLRQRQIYASSTPNYQFDYDFKDSGVIIDATRLTLLFVEHTATYNAGDCQKIEEFLRDFIPAFFGFPRKDLDQSIGAMSRRSPDEDVEETPAAWDPPSTRSRRSGNGKKTDLLRGVLERGRNGKPSRKDKEGSAASGSEESMLDVGSAVDEDANGGAEGSVGCGSPKEDDYASQAWISHPSAVDGRRGNVMVDLQKNQPYARSQFHLYCNNTIYGFFRLFQILYERLLHCKQHESEVAEDIRRRKMPKPAIDLKMMDKGPDDFFPDSSPTANYYNQVLEMCEQVVEGKLDPTLFEDALRHFYIARGWELYSIDKLLGSIVKQAHTIVLSDAKDKSHDIIVQFLKNREKEATTHSEEITYRRTIEKFVKDDPLYRITFDTEPSSKVATIQILDPNDATYNDVNLDAQTKWSYYVASYHRAEPTEGIVWSRVRNSFLHRLINQALGEYDRGFDKLEMRIAVGCYKAFFVAGTMDFWCRSAQQQALANVSEADAQRVKEKRNRKFEEKFVMNNLWMKGMSKDEVERKNEEFRRWVKDGILAGAHREQVDEGDLMVDAA